MLFPGYYSNVNTDSAYLDQANRATYKGVTIKSIILLAIVVATALLTGIFLPTLINQNGFYYTLVTAVIVGSIAALLGRFIPSIAMPCSFIYSFSEGLVLGTITAIVNAFYPTAGTLAVSATLVIFTIMLVLYAFGFIRNGSLIRMILFGLLFAILGLSVLNLVFYLISGAAFVITYILIEVAELIYGVVMLAFMFYQAEVVVKLGAPKEVEWSVALGIQVALIYIYIYMLRVMALISRRS